MIDYIKYLIRNFRKVNNKLVDLSKLLDRSWVLVKDFNDANQKWIFRRNGSLIISDNGDITDGTWEYLKRPNHLVVQFGSNKYLLNQTFLHDDILLLQKDSKDIDALVFFDLAIYNFKEFLFYLRGVRVKELNIIKFKLTDGVSVEIVRRPNSKGVSIGDAVLINGVLTTKSQIDRRTVIYELKNGKIKNSFFKKKYSLNYDNEITIKQKLNNLSINDEIIGSAKIIENGLYKLKYNRGAEIVNMKIKMPYWILKKSSLFVRSLEFWQKNKNYIYLGDLVFYKNKPAENGYYFILSEFKLMKIYNGKIHRM